MSRYSTEEHSDRGSTAEGSTEDPWIAIEPPTPSELSDPRSRPFTSALNNHPDHTYTHTSARENAVPGSSHSPPTFDEAQFGTILRRQRLRPADNSGLKTSSAFPSRFINLSNSFEFAGWGSLTTLKLSKNDHDAGVALVEAYRKDQILGQFTAGALAGNAILGSVFYALPAVVAVGGI